MANSSHIKFVVEPFIVDWVSRRIGIGLSPQQIVVGPRMDGTPVKFSFDGVSKDRQIGLLVSASQTVKPGGVRKLHVDVSILLRASFSRRIMAFTNSDVLLNFVNKCDGLLPLCEIEMLLCDSVPGDMLARIAEFQTRAKRGWRQGQKLEARRKKKMKFPIRAD
jgi:hypothetical protein